MIIKPRIIKIGKMFGVLAWPVGASQLNQHEGELQNLMNDCATEFVSVMNSPASAYDEIGNAYAARYIHARFDRQSLMIRNRYRHRNHFAHELHQDLLNNSRPQ